MKTIWTRAAQAQSSCRCRTCLHSTHALIRRSATSAPRRKISVADVFTACYTTILGTATILDARHKNQRRQALDGELARAKSSLARPAPEELKSFLDMDDEELLALDDVYRQHPRSRPLPTYVTNRRGYESVLPFLKELREAYNIKNQSFAQQSWLQDQMDWVNIESNVIAESQDRRARARRAMAPQELTQTTRAVLLLLDELLNRVNKNESPRAQDKNPDPLHAARTLKILEEVEHIKRGCVYPSYEIPDRNPRHSARVQNSLHESIRRIFNKALSSRETVGRISFNLLISPMPPTMHTYNVLIAGFNRIERPDLAQAVIDSYIYRTPWTATEQTVLCMLTHCRAPGYRKGLRAVVQRMRGRKPYGGKTPSLIDNHSPISLVEKVKGPLKYHSVLKKKRSDHTFDHLIRGWLYHHEVGIACMTFVASLRRRASIPLTTLQELLRACLHEANFANARKIVIGILRYLDYFRRYIPWLMESNTTTTVRSVLRSLHQMVDICWYPLGEIYGVSWQTYFIKSESLKLLISRWQMEIEVKDMKQLRRLLDEALLSDGSLVSRLERAIAHLDTAKSGRDIMSPLEKAYDTLATLVSIERRYLDLERTSRELDIATKVSLIRFWTGYNLDERTMLLSNSVVNQSMMARRFALRHALRHVNVWDGVVNMYTIKAQLFRAIPNPDLISQLEENHNWKRLGVQTLLFFFRRNMVHPRPEESSDQPYWPLEQQARAAEDSIRALLFTYLETHKQRAALWFYGNYYAIPFDKLVEYADRQIYISERDGTPNYGPGRRSPLAEQRSIPSSEPKLFRVVMAVSAMTKIKGRETVNKHDGPQLWPIHRGEDAPPRHAALG